MFTDYTMARGWSPTLILADHDEEDSEEEDADEDDEDEAEDGEEGEAFAEWS